MRTGIHVFWSCDLHGAAACASLEPNACAEVPTEQWRPALLRKCQELLHPFMHQFGSFKEQTRRIQVKETALPTRCSVLGRARRGKEDHAYTPVLNMDCSTPADWYYLCLIGMKLQNSELDTHWVPCMPQNADALIYWIRHPTSAARCMLQQSQRLPQISHAQSSCWGYLAETIPPMVRITAGTPAQASEIRHPKLRCCVPMLMACATTIPRLSTTCNKEDE